jgi:hypothetical protein
MTGPIATGRWVVATGMNAKHHLMVQSEHDALIEWSDEQVKCGLPTTTESVDPALFARGEEGWSISCCFDILPSKQGNPSRVRVQLGPPMLRTFSSCRERGCFCSRERQESVHY